MPETEVNQATSQHARHRSTSSQCTRQPTLDPVRRFPRPLALRRRSAPETCPPQSRSYSRGGVSKTEVSDRLALEFFSHCLFPSSLFPSPSSSPPGILSLSLSTSSSHSVRTPLLVVSHSVDALLTVLTAPTRDLNHSLTVVVVVASRVSPSSCTMDQNNNHHDDGQTPPKLPSFRELLSTLSIPDPIVPGHPHSQLPMLSDPCTGSPIGPQKGLRSRIRGSESASPSPDRENYPASAFRSPQSYVSPPKRPGSDRTASMRSPEDLHIVPSNASTSYALSPASYGPVSPSHHHLANAHLAAAQSQVHTRSLDPVDLPVSPPSLPSPSQSHHSHSGVYRSVLQRAYRACAECRLRKVRCNTPTGSEKCQRCIERDLPCGEADATPPAPGSSSINEWSPGTIQGREKRRRLSEDVELQGPG